MADFKISSLQMTAFWGGLGWTSPCVEYLHLTLSERWESRTPTSAASWVESSPWALWPFQGTIHPSRGKILFRKAGSVGKLRNGDFLSLNRTDTVLFITVIMRLVPLGFIISVCVCVCVLLYATSYRTFRLFHERGRALAERAWDRPGFKSHLCPHKLHVFFFHFFETRFPGL